MIDRLIHFSVHNKLLVGLGVLLMAIWGIFSLTQLPIDAVPDITNNQVQVVTISPTLAPQEVEQYITYPVEIAMANLPRVSDIRSISRYGLSVVTIVFEEDYDLLKARQLVGEQLAAAQGDIPPGLGTPSLMPITTGLGEIFQYCLVPKPGFEKQYDAMELRTLQDWIVKRQLSGIPGIVEVSSFGGKVKEYEVAVDPDKLSRMQVTIQDLEAALAANNENTGGSYIQKGPYAYYVRAEGMLRTPDDIGQVVVKSAKGVPVLVRDLAEVRYGSAPRYGAMTRDGHGEVVGGITLMLKGGNANDVIARVKDRIEQVNKSLPQGVELQPYLDRASLVDRVMQTVAKNLLEGGLIVIFVLVIMLGNFRAGAVVASVIPLSMLFALSLMNVFGVSANLMSLGAIDFGLIVDGAVVIVEAILHYLHGKDVQQQLGGRSLTQSEMDGVVTKAAGRIMRSAAFGVIIILIVYLPILALVGVEGKTFKPMALTVSFAIIGALLLSLTYVPMMSALLLDKKVHSEHTFADKLIDFLQGFYGPTLHWALAHRTKVLGMALALLIGGLALFSTLGSVFVPTLEEGDLAMQMTLPPGSSLDHSVATTTKAERILKERFPEVKHVVSKIGTAEVPTDPMAIEDADIMIVMKPKDEWTSAKTREELVAKMKVALEDIRDASFDFSQPIQLRFNELMTGVKTDIAIKLYGDDLETLAAKAREIAQLVGGIQGVGDIKVEQTEGLPQLFIRYDRQRLAQYGLNIADLNQTVRAAMAGEQVGMLYEGERRFGLVVRMTERYRGDEGVFDRVMVRTAQGQLVPVSELAKVELLDGPMQISRSKTRRFTFVGINVRDRDIQGLVDDIDAKLQAELRLPAGYYITYGGQFENLKEASQRLSIAVPVALGLIFLLLFLAFGSFKQAMAIFTAIPFAAIGGILGLWLRDMPFSISAGVGFIALFGVAVLNGIVMLGYFNDLQQQRPDAGLRDIVREGAQARLRPVLMTAAVAALGFLPMAVSSSAGGEVQQPLATVVIGGLVTATLLTLVVLPVLYTFIGDERKDKKKPVDKANMSAALSLLALLGLGLFTPGRAQAQEVLSLEQAQQLARQKHVSLQQAQAEQEVARLAQGAAWDLGPTSFSWQRGQYNNPGFFDNGFTLTQNIGAPLEQGARHRLAKQEYALSQVRTRQIEQWLMAEVAQSYVEWALNWRRVQLLEQQDSLLSKLLELSEVRYRSGEVNLLGKTMLSTKRAEVASNLQALRSELKASEERLSQYTLTSGTYLPQPGTLKLQPAPLPVAEQPAYQMAQQQVEVAERQVSVAKNGFTPGLSVSYLNNEIDGRPNNPSFMVGVEIPLWFRPQQRRLQSAKVQQQLADNQLQYAAFALERQQEIRRTEVQKWQGKLDYYERSALAEARIIEEKSTELFKAGEISQLEHLLALNQVTDLRMGYWNALQAYNLAVIQLNHPY